MSLNNLILNPQMLAQLYGNVLVEANASDVPDKKGVHSVGKNEKGIHIWLREPQEEIINKEDLQFLQSVLTACKLDSKDVVITNIAKIENVSGLIKDLDKIVLLFDIDPLFIGLPFQFPHFQIQGFNGRQYLGAPSLSHLAKHLEAKKKLWVALKTLFQL